MNIELKGLDDLAKKLEEFKKKAEDASGNVGIDELLTDGFMRLYTDYQTAQDFFGAFPIKFKNQEEWDQISKEEKDTFVKANTIFDSWEDMIGKAGKEYLKRKLKI